MEAIYENSNQQVAEAEAELNEYHPYVLNYYRMASSGACDHPEGFHDREWAMGPFGNDPTPLRVGSLRHDYYTAGERDDGAAAELMEVETFPAGERLDGVNPIWRPEYNVCLQDLEFHAACHWDNPYYSTAALHVFKQCLMSYVPRRTANGTVPGSDEDLAEQKGFADLIKAIYDSTRGGELIREICIKFGLWVRLRCGPRRGWSTDCINLFKCELEAGLRCFQFSADVDAELELYHLLRPELREEQEAERRRREERVEARQEQARREAQRHYQLVRRRRRQRRLHRQWQEQETEAVQPEQDAREPQLQAFRREERRLQAGRERETARRRTRYWTRRFRELSSS